MMYEFLKNHTVWVWLLIALATGCPTLTVALEQAMTSDGILDITQAPYHADNTGRRDVSDVLQRAVIDARNKRCVLFLPAGRYRVSETIIAPQIKHPRSSHPLINRRCDFPCMIWGQRTGERSTILLEDEAPGFTDPDNPRPVLFFNDPENPENPNINFNQMLVSVDVDLGQGNAGAIGVDNQGAQGTVTEDVHITARDGFAGFRGAPGSGGSTSHISVTGGRFGLYLARLDRTWNYSGSQPVPTISSCRLSGQRESAVIVGTRGPLTLVGTEIEGAGIRLTGPWGAWNGALNLVDSVLRIAGNGPAVTGTRPVVLSNVFFRGTPTIVQLDRMPILTGNDRGWTHVRTCAASPSESYPIWFDGKRLGNSRTDAVSDSPPPADLLATHRWPESLPDWDDPGVFNVRSGSFAASGDGVADDTEALQRAITEHRDVFLPRGIYRITRPLEIRSDSRIFGLHIHSKIDPDPTAPAFSDPASPKPAVHSPNDPKATCTLAFLQISARGAGAFSLHWQSGRKSTVRNVRTRPWPWHDRESPAEHPLILIDGHGGGRWYNALMHFKFPQTGQHRHILVRGTREPLVFYMLNPEHSNAEHMIEIDHAKNVTVFGLKSETLGAGGPRASTPVLIRNSHDIHIFGHGGNAVPEPGKPMYRLIDSHDITLANLTIQPFKSGPAPDNWFLVEEVATKGEVIRTPGTENIALYRRSSE